MKMLLIILMLSASTCFGLDTLCTNPYYPPITYKKGEYHYYKYTAKYIPESMLHSFKILATCGDNRLAQFVEKEEVDVLKDGMFQRGFRMRKEFCLEGYSSFAGYFHQRGIYYPFAMKTYILLSFHQYLKKERIRWHYNKRVALTDRKDLNRSWKKRIEHVFEPIILDKEPPSVADPSFMDPIEQRFYTY